MTAGLGRWELVEPFLLAHALRAPRTFESSETDCVPEAALEALRVGRLMDEPAISRALRGASTDRERHQASSILARQPIHDALEAAATRWLVCAGDAWNLRVEPSDPGHELLRWRGATLLLPSSILVAAALAATDQRHPRSVALLCGAAAPAESVAHGHVHLGPMLPFECLWLELWSAFLRRGSLAISHDNPIARARQSPDLADRYGHARTRAWTWQWLLELAFIARAWLLERPSHPPPRALEAFRGGRVDVSERRASLHALLMRREHTDFATRLRRLARHEARALTHTSGRDDTEAEIDFLAQALHRCRSSGADARLLYQYLRVKVALYRHLVVDPWTPGLAHFLEVVARDSPYLAVIGETERARLDRKRLACALDERPLNVRNVEVHVHPAYWLKAGGARRREPLSPHGTGANQRSRTPSVETTQSAWILSAIRSAIPQRPNKYDGKDPEWKTGRYWRRAAVTVASELRAVERAIASAPSSLRLVRAIGLMAWERNGPVWLFRTALNRLLEHSRTVAAQHAALNLEPLRTAIHLGEDFGYLLTGLRQIFEPFEWGLIARGDRIGHGLALGRSPQDWVRDNSLVRVRRFDRIVDAGFAFWAFETFGLAIGEALPRLNASVARELETVFEVSFANPLATARKIWEALGALDVRTMPLHATPPQAKSSARELVVAMLDLPSVRRRALDETVTIDTGAELEMLRAIHAMVKERVTKWQVAIEVNPSSNLLIGGFRSIFEQPTFHTPDVPITLNADDPLTFATSLADEYAYAWAGMVVANGRSPSEATSRLEHAARCSTRFAFTRPGFR